MKTLEEQINWLEDHITYLYFLKVLYKNKRIVIEGISVEDAIREIFNQIIEFEQVLESLYILL
jgi:hypothetical protein